MRIYLKELWQECEEGCLSLFKELQNISKKMNTTALHYSTLYGEQRQTLRHTTSLCNTSSHTAAHCNTMLCTLHQTLHLTISHTTVQNTIFPPPPAPYPSNGHFYLDRCTLRAQDIVAIAPCGVVECGGVQCVVEWGAVCCILVVFREIALCFVSICITLCVTCIVFSVLCVFMSYMFVALCVQI